jgi:hypothetical protein
MRVLLRDSRSVKMAAPSSARYSVLVTTGDANVMAATIMAVAFDTRPAAPKFALRKLETLVRCITGEAQTRMK